MSFWSVLFASVPQNWYIFFAVALAIASGVMAWRNAKVVESCFRPDGGSELKSATYYTLDVSYTLFVAIISIFPLLGLFGTVKSLLMLDITGAAQAVQGNFFEALTSTAWGIIFAIIFKMINAFLQPYAENNITLAKGALKLTEEKSDE